jgi:hypothetical protein
MIRVNQSGRVTAIVLFFFSILAFLPCFVAAPSIAPGITVLHGPNSPARRQTLRRFGFARRLLCITS